MQILEHTPAVRQALRRTRIFICLGQWPKTTANRKWQHNSLQYGTFRAELLSQDFRQFHPARAQVRLLHRYCRTRLMILRHVQQQNEVTTRTFQHRETDRAIQQKTKKRGQRTGIEKSSARFARLVRGVHRKSRRQRFLNIPGHTRKHFSRFRFGTS